MKQAELILEDIRKIIIVLEKLVNKTPQEIVNKLEEENIEHRIQKIENYYKESEFVKQYQNAEAEILSVKASFNRVIEMARCNHPKMFIKLEFELIPLTKNLRLDFYYFNWIYPDKEKMKNFFDKEVSSYYYSPYVERAKKTGNYKYDLSIIVLAYNKLEYTKMCVRSLKRFLPTNIKYELVFINHGSTDGTKKFFENENPDKQIDIEVNGGGLSVLESMLEGEYALLISNDVLVTKNSIENMYRCVTSDKRIGWVVATTPNIYNLQSIAASYSTLGEMYQFAEKNNVSDERRWEEKVRLCNPIDMYKVENMINCVCKKIKRPEGIVFPDDKISSGFRQSGYKLILAKDSYCYHFGSVTVKDEMLNPLSGQIFYTQGRIKFMKELGIDPWGYGFCHNPLLMNRLDFFEENYGDVLGINSGMGENPLKIRNMFNEKLGKRNCKITYLTQYEMNLKDLQGLGNKTYKVGDWTEYKEVLRDKYSYILLENGVTENNISSIYGLFDFLNDHGKILVRVTDRNLFLKIKSVFKGKEILNQENDYWVELIFEN